MPSQLLQNRPDIRQAERELAAAGLDVKVARARFFPALIINGGVGYEAFNPRYLLLTPEALIGNIAGGLVAPLINRKAIQAEYLNANARQLQAVYNYQRVVLNAFTEVINRVSMVENYGKSIEIKKQQLHSLEASVEAANSLFQNARVDYMDVLFAQRDLMEREKGLDRDQEGATVCRRERLSSPRRQRLFVAVVQLATAASSPRLPYRSFLETLKSTRIIRDAMTAPACLHNDCTGVDKLPILGSNPRADSRARE